MTRSDQLDWGAPAHILVVDDMEASRYVVATSLRRSGHVVTEASTGSEALRLVTQPSVDLVVLDVNLPDMTGFEVCERIKQDAATASLPVLHVSATAITPQDRASGLSRGADAYLTEPVDPAVLVATVNAALRYSRARAATERLATRLARLTAGTLDLNTAATFDELIRTATATTATIMESSAVAVIVSADGQQHLGFAAGPGGAVEVAAAAESWWRTVGQATLDNSAGARITVLPDGADGAPVELAGWTAVFARRKAGRHAVCVAVPAGAVATDTDRDLLLQWGQATALVTESLWVYAEEHGLALTLQRSLLPRRLPSHPRLSMAARYVPAAANAEVGGDFYEITELGDRLLVAIGDVTGHSINAATIMGEVRHALRAYALEGHQPVHILDLLNTMLRRFHPIDGFTTLCLLLVDPETGTAQVANAGHLPPLVVDGTGARYLDIAGPMLGLDLPRPTAVTIGLEPGATVVLITDGLIERRGVPIEDSMAELSAALAPRIDGPAPELEGLCDQLLARFGQDGTDDIALLALRRA